MVRKIYICTVHPWAYYYATEEFMHALEWWWANEDAAGKRQIRKVRWDMTQEVTSFYETAGKLLDEKKPAPWEPVVHIGGRDGGGCWLDPFDTHGAFCYRAKSDHDYKVSIAQILFKRGEVTHLRTQSPLEANPIDMWVKNVDFCSKHNLIEVLAYRTIEDEPEQSDEQPSD